MMEDKILNTLRFWLMSVPVFNYQLQQVRKRNSDVNQLTGMWVMTVIIIVRDFELIGSTV